MQKKNLSDLIRLDLILILLGLIVVCAGLYFQINDLTDSGINMGPYASARYNGKAFTFCGIAFIGIGYMVKDPKKKPD